MDQALVDRCRSDACLFHQPPGSGDGVLHEGPVDLQCGCYGPAKATDFITIIIRQIDKLPCRVHRLGSRYNNCLSEEVKPDFPVTGQTHIIQQAEAQRPRCLAGCHRSSSGSCGILPVSGCYPVPWQAVWSASLPSCYFILRLYRKIAEGGIRVKQFYLR